MKQFFVVGILFMLVVSCKSKSAMVSEKASVDTSSSRTLEESKSKKVIQRHYEIPKNFKTLYIKANAQYQDPKQSYNASVEIKIKKDEIILVSVRFLGITMAKAKITPNQVLYYEKLGGNYFEGDYQSLSQWLGTDLDFKKVQNLLLGEALLDLTQQEFAIREENGTFQLKNTISQELESSFWIENQKFLLVQQNLAQATNKRKLEVNYTNHKEFSQTILPLKLFIAASQNERYNKINLDYAMVDFDQELSFAYSVPNGYEKINIR